MKLRTSSPAAIRAPFGRYAHVVEVQRCQPAALPLRPARYPPRRHRCPDDVAGQAAQAFANIDACLEAAGVTRAQVLRLTVFLTEAEYRQGYMRVRDAWVADPPPASTLLVVKALALPACKVEIEAIAAA